MVNYDRCLECLEEIHPDNFEEEIQERGAYTKVRIRRCPHCGNAVYYNTICPDPRRDGSEAGQKFNVTTHNGVAYLPVPADPADARELYEADATYHELVNRVAGDHQNAEAVLRSGPNCFEVALDRVGVFDDA